MRIIPVQPEPDQQLADASTEQTPRTVGRQVSASRRTFGFRVPSRRTFGGRYPSRRTFGYRIP